RYGENTGVARVWDLAVGREQFTLTEGFARGVTAVSFSADGRRLAAAGGGREVQVWDTETGGLVGRVANATPRDRPDFLTFSSVVGFSPDGSYLAVGGFFGDGALNLFDAADFHWLRKLHQDQARTRPHVLAFSP